MRLEIIDLKEDQGSLNTDLINGEFGNAASGLDNDSASWFEDDQRSDDFYGLLDEQNPASGSAEAATSKMFTSDDEDEADGKGKSFCSRVNDLT